MNTPYQPSTSLSAKVARRLLPFQARRELSFTIERPIVSFTFDDFPRSAIENGANVLARQNWKATFYVAAGLQGLTNHHGENFSAEDLKYLQSAGHEIAGHTFGHMDCVGLPVSKVMDDIDRNQAMLKSMGVKGDTEHFAFPYGAANPALKRELAARFKSLRGIAPGVHWGKVDLNGLKSTPVFSGDKLHQAVDLIEGLKKRPGWLTLFTHDIREDHSQWGCTPMEFNSVIKAVQDSGALVLPVGEAIEHLEANHG